MKKFIYMMPFLVLLLGCSINGDEDLNLQGYAEWSTEFYPNSVSNLYHVKFNNSDKHYIHKNETKGTLEVYMNKNDSLVLRVENAKLTNGKFTFVQTMAGRLELYEEGKYQPFTASVIYTDGSATDYILKLNDFVIQNQETYYINNSDLGKAKLSITRKSNGELLSTIPLSQETENISLFQSGENFIEIPKDPIDPPKECMNIRFFYTKEDLPGIDSIQITIYPTIDFVQWGNEIGSIKLKTGELSNYMLVDWNKNLVDGQIAKAIDYDIIDLSKPNEKLIDHLGNNWGISSISRGFKFVTGHIMSDPDQLGKRLNYVQALSKDW